MPTFSNNPISTWFKRLFQIKQSSNTGVDGTVRNMETGDGAATSMWVSDDKFQVRPDDSNSTQAFMVANEAGSQILAVDTTNSKVLLGTSPINQQTKEFGIFDLSPTAGYHYPLIANNMLTAASATDFGADNDWGNGTDPATTLDVSGLTARQTACASYWPVPGAITLLSVTALVHCDDSDAATINVHLFSYDMDDSPAGDLSGGTVHASGTTPCTNAQIKKITCTLDAASISSGKTIVAFVENATDTDDVTVSMQVQYYINI